MIFSVMVPVAVVGAVGIGIPVLAAYWTGEAVSGVGKAIMKKF
jgi:hypothetical protein